MANPKITWCSDETVTYEEAAFIEQYDQVTRPAKIRVSFLNKKNRKSVKLTGYWLPASSMKWIIQGTLFVDHLSHLKRTMILRKLKKLKKLNVS